MLNDKQRAILDYIGTVWWDECGPRLLTTLERASPLLLVKSVDQANAALKHMVACVHGYADELELLSNAVAAEMHQTEKGGE